MSVLFQVATLTQTLQKEWQTQMLMEEKCKRQEADMKLEANAFAVAFLEQHEKECQEIREELDIVSNTREDRCVFTRARIYACTNTCVHAC